MGAIVIALAGFGYQLTKAAAQPVAGDVDRGGAVRGRAADAGVADQPRAAAARPAA